MKLICDEITKEEYMNNKDKSASEIIDFVKSKIPPAIIWGYGCYDCRIKEDNGKYYMTYMQGDSCD